MRIRGILVLISASVIFAPSFARSQQAATAPSAESIQEILAAQVRLQGLACDQALQARRDARLSKPDHQVWVLKCSNATYSVSRAPDMAADIKRLR